MTQLQTHLREDGRRRQKACSQAASDVHYGVRHARSTAISSEAHQWWGSCALSLAQLDAQHKEQHSSAQDVEAALCELTCCGRH